MGLELFVYSPIARPVTGGALVDALAALGWGSALPPSHVFIGGVREDRSVIAPVEGTLYGWPAGSGDGGAARELVARIPFDLPSTRRKARTLLEALPTVGGCEVRFGAYELDDETRDDLRPRPDLIARMGRARLVYTIRTSSRQGQPSRDLQHATGRALANVVGGVHHDPMTLHWE